MGICVSSNRRESNSPPTVKIMTVNGDLREYNAPVLASQVLEAESAAAPSSSSSSRPSSYFICDSDSLCYDDFIPAIESEQPLQAEHIYFVLPISKRQSRLTASEPFNGVGHGGSRRESKRGDTELRGERISPA
ncbi:hypothetical protein F2Q70_00031018 [Brassica cretica]|uniref:Uncharacterized protein n=1 Tax=Brassica cretica TaxID=69181 RepID=A0A8S9FLV6_BRACR|nr:hypothetical protein F2Q70_00031018 [Brassica cretica]